MGNGVPYETNGGMMTILEFASIFYLIQMIVTVLFICTDFLRYEVSASQPCDIGYRVAKIFIALVAMIHVCGLILVTALYRYDYDTMTCA